MVRKLLGKLVCFRQVAGSVAFGLVVVIGCTARQEVAESESTGRAGAVGPIVTPEPAKPAGDYVTAGPVSVRLRCQPSRVRPGESAEFVVEFRVAPMWEIHTLESTPAEAAIRLSLELPSGIEAAGDWQTPPPQTSFAPAGKMVYAGEFAMRRAVRIRDSAASGVRRVVCRTRFQACNEQQCLRPTEIELEATLVVD